MATLDAFFKLNGDKVPHDAVVVQYNAHEGISLPYEIIVEFYTEDTGFHVDTCLRTRMLLTVTNEKGETRFFDGVVDRAEFSRVVGPRLYFGVRLRPALAALDHREDSRIFQNKSIVDITTQIFKDAGFGEKVQWDIKGTYEPKEFIVQYRESELNFVSRLFEDAGIFYFFKHSVEGHTMVIADDSGAFVLEDGAPPVQFAMTQGLASLGNPLQDFARVRSLRTTSVRLRDYDFEKPQLKPEGTLDHKDAVPLAYYEYPGGFIKSTEGGQRATARLRELRRDADVCHGRSEAIGLRCGVPFTVDGAAEVDLNEEFIVTDLVSRGKQTPEGHDEEHGGENYACNNDFAGIPKDALYAAPRRAPRPKIRGIQTAVVTSAGTAEQSIHTDKYGRIKIRFYWDRIGQQDDTSSCWVRVSQLGMGGSMILPRVGWEVSVAFLEGNPDRPIVLGRVYNAEKTPPYALPGAKASGSIKSMSTPGGGGHNEIKMSDSGGSQGFGIHAEKDLNITINHDKTEKVGVNEEHNIKVNASASVGSNETVKIGGNQSIDVGAVLSDNVGGAQSITVGGNDTSNAISNYVENITGARSYTISGRQMTLQNGIRLQSTDSFTRQVGAVQVVASVASISSNILGAYTSKVGAVTVHLVNGSHGETVGGDKKLISAAAELHLVTGSFTASSDADVTHLIGGLHYKKIAGDYSVKAPKILLAGAVGDFKGGGSNVKLGGGPVVLKGSKIAIKTPMLVKMSSGLKLGS